MQSTEALMKDSASSATLVDSALAAEAPRTFRIATRTGEGDGRALELSSAHEVLGEGIDPSEGALQERLEISCQR